MDMATDLTTRPPSSGVTGSKLNRLMRAAVKPVIAAT